MSGSLQTALCGDVCVMRPAVARRGQAFQAQPSCLTSCHCLFLFFIERGRVGDRLPDSLGQFYEGMTAKMVLLL